MLLPLSLVLLHTLKAITTKTVLTVGKFVVLLAPDPDLVVTSTASIVKELEERCLTDL